MDFLCFKFLVGLVFAQRVSSLPVGCHHNGTSYNEGEMVQMGEPCLSCVCQKGALSCNLRVCADYWEALPPGCVLVHKPNDCCPQLFCDGGFSPNGIELRGGVRLENKVDGNGCIINGTIYGEGSAVGSWDPCEYCYCADGGLKCVKPRCVQSFEGCKAVYEKSSCCPTHFDCRDTKVNFYTSQVKHFVTTNLSSNLPEETFRSFPDTDSESHTEETTTESEENSTPPEEKTTLMTTTTEDITEGTTFDPQPETTSPPPTDSPTTLQTTTFQTTGNPKESSTLISTEEPTPEATSEESSGVEDTESRSPVTTEAAVGSWNSSEIADDYDSYDYGEPKLPPSLPNLVIFPFVAADAVVKDERAELYDDVQIERIDDQPIVYKDFFSPPTRTEGGFVPKQPALDTFYDLPYLRKKPTEPPHDVKQTSAQINAPPQASNGTPFPHHKPTHDLPTTKNTTTSSFDGPHNPELPSRDITTNIKKFSMSSGPLNELIQTEMPSEFFFKGDSDRKTHQTKKPVTVTYKNVVVDFYPDYLVTTTRSQSTAPSVEISSSTPVSLNVVPDYFGYFEETTTLGIPTAAPPQPPTVASTTKESSFFDTFLKTFLEEDTPTVTTITSTKHKYSSKIKGHVTTTKPEVLRTSPSPTVPQMNVLSKSEGPSTAAQQTDRPERETGDLQQENSVGEASEEAPDRIRPNPATLLKLAGCNIYGMMYRIGKVITELSGPCVECLCTDLGVQCTPLDC